MVTDCFCCFLHSFYGLVVIEVQGNTVPLSEVVDFGLEYPDLMPYQEDQTTNYYLTAAWNSIEDIPDTFAVGDDTETTATYEGAEQVYLNKGLSRLTQYHLFVIVHVDSGVPNVSCQLSINTLSPEYIQYMQQISYLVLTILCLLQRPLIRFSSVVSSVEVETSECCVCVLFLCWGRPV